MIFKFGSQEAFYMYLWLVPLVLFIGTLIAKRAKKKIHSKLGDRLTPFLMSSISITKRKFKLLLEILTVVLFVIAMARPQLGSSLQEVKSEGIEIMLLVDVSKSMLAEDNRPNRLETIKIEIKRLLDRFTGDRVGLVVFAGNAFLVSPLTTDYGAVKLFLDSLTTESVSTQGTEIKPALDAAVEAFKRGGVSEEEGVAVTKVILIASDGEDHDEGAIKAAQKYAKEGVRIFALGVGTEQGAPIPVRDEFGYLKGYLKDESNQVVNSQHHGDFLTKLATTAGGGYYHVSSSTAVDQIKAQLDRLQKAQFETSLATEYEERFQLFLLFGIIFGLIELILGERKSGSTIWRGRLSGIGATVILLFSPWIFALTTPGTITKNNEAAKNLKEKQSYQAYRDLTELLSSSPFQPEVRLNLAYAFELNEEFDKAAKEYLAVANSNVDEKQKFEAYFNAARIYGQQKKIPEALEYYQKALNIDPTSVEAKTNIELLFQQGKGGGEDDNKDKKEGDEGKDSEQKKESGGQDKKQQEQKPQSQEKQSQEKQKRAPQPFKSQELSERDVKNILDELKRQEEKNRAKMMEQPNKENSRGPDW